VRLAVIFALDVEWTPWRDRHAFRTTRDTVHDIGHDVHEADIGRSHVRAAVCGVCAPRAAATVAAVCDDGAGGTGALIIAGFAGGLRPAYRAGDVIVARQVHRDLTPDDHGPATPIPCAADLVMLASTCGATVVESLVTIDHIAGSVDEKSRLGLAHDIVDMESALLLAEARARGIPAVVIRVIGDPVDDPVPIELLRSVGPDHEVRPRRFALEIARRPWRWPTIARSFLAHDHARKRLALYLDRFIDALDTCTAAIVSAKASSDTQLR
jgi:nucleoside phosphorylase